MGDIALDIANDLQQAETARRHHAAALLEYQAACLRYDWPAAEDARARAIGALESSLDHLMVAYQRMQAELAGK